MSYKFVGLSGGLDLETPPIEVPPGACLEAYNFYEAVKGGYTTVDGYVKFDGTVDPTVPAVVPGSGDIRGVAMIRDDVLAWRDDGSDLKCYKASASSWVEIPLAAVYEVDTSSATVAAAGDVCNSGQDKILGVYDYLSAGAPDTGKRVYVVQRISGGVPTAFTNDVGAVNHGSVLGTVSWAPSSGGRVEYINHNFYAGLNTYDMYFTDGVNCAMTYNYADTVIQPISADYRTLAEVCGHVIAHNNRLLMSTSGGTYLTSEVGVPTSLDAFLGAQEVGVGDDITGFAATSAEELVIFTRNRTFGVKGTDASNWEKRIISENSGARAYSITQIDDVFSSDDRGIAQLSRTDALGGFNAGTVTDDVQSLFKTISNEATAATTIRELNQMRFYYGERFLIASRVPYNANGNEGIRYGITEGRYPVPVKVMTTDEDSSGDEKSYFGSTDGYIYQADTGTSFDGAEIECRLSLHFNHLGSPMTRKRFMGVEFESLVNADSTFQIYYFMNDGQKTFDPRAVGFLGGAGTWDESLFDVAGFDGIPLTRPKMSLRGTGYNIQFVFYRSSTTELSATITGYALRYKNRGLTAI